MLNSSQNFVIILFAVLGSLLFMWVLNHFWPKEKRREHNDQIGWQLTALGTTYAVILGFMLYAVWTGFGAADLNVNLEADALVNVYRLAAGLPEAQKQHIRDLARAYADAAIEKDWPAMANAAVPNATRDINSEMWQALVTMKGASETEQSAQSHALSVMTSLTAYQRTRVLQSTATMPTVLWCVLIAGAVLSVASSCLFGSANEILHALQVFAFALLIAISLVAIGDINRPFQGTVHVSTFAFTRAQDSMRLP